MSGGGRDGATGMVRISAAYLAPSWLERGGVPCGGGTTGAFGQEAKRKNAIVYGCW